MRFTSLPRWAAALAGVVALLVGGILVVRPLASLAALLALVVISLVLLAISEWSRNPSTSDLRIARVRSAGWLVAALVIVLWPWCSACEWRGWAPPRSGRRSVGLPTPPVTMCPAEGLEDSPGHGTFCVPLECLPLSSCCSRSVRYCMAATPDPTPSTRHHHTCHPNPANFCEASRSSAASRIMRKRTGCSTRRHSMTASPRWPAPSS